MTFTLRSSAGQESAVVGELRIGRDPECEIQLADERVSRVHARVWADGERLLVRDEHSSNGTRVNGRTLLAGEPRALHAGDTLRVGGTSFTIAVGAGQAASPPFRLPANAADVPPGVTDGGPNPLAARRGPSRALPLAIGGCLVLAVLAVCGGLGIYGATAGRPALGTALAPKVEPSATPAPRPATPSAATSGAASVVRATALTGTPVPNLVGSPSSIPAQVLSTSPAVTPLSPTQYAATSQDLASALAALNHAQLHCIADAHNLKGQAAPGALDEDLRNIAALAFKIGLDGESLGLATAAQDNGSDAAGQMSALYASLARYGYAQALDAQNLRIALAAGTLDPAQAAVRLADYGARAWNPSVTDPNTKGNPFVPHLDPSNVVPAAAPLAAPAQAALQNDIGPMAGLLTWIAAPAGAITRTVSVPSVEPLANPEDPALLATLVTPAGQVDSHTSSQAAAAGLQRLGAVVQPPAGGSSFARVLAALWAPLAQGSLGTMSFAGYQAMVVSDKNPRGQGNIYSFISGLGQVVASSPPANGGNQDIVDTLFDMDPNNQPTQRARVAVQAVDPAVTLTLADIAIKSSGSTGSSGGFAKWSFGLSWHTSLTNPHFRIVCGPAPYVQLASTASGSVEVEATSNVLPYPGIAYVDCQAVGGAGGGYFGHVAATVFVGDRAEATANAQGTQQENDRLATLTQQAIDRQGTLTQVASNVQSKLGTEQASRQTAEFVAKITQIAAGTGTQQKNNEGTATTQAANLMTLNGTFNLTQGDSGCTFSDAPSTAGTLQLSVDFNQGKANATLQGGGGGTRTGLSCNGDSGDMTWQQTYTASFTGSIDPASGALSLKGTLSGSNNVRWSNCTHGGDSGTCPASYANSYSFPITLSGMVDKAGRTGSGTLQVQQVSLPTSGDWSAGQ